jgi:hypothetical protein
MSAHGSESLGSARVSRAGFGVALKRSSLRRHLDSKGGAREVRDSEDAIASTRDGCATPDGV